MDETHTVVAHVTLAIAAVDQHARIVGRSVSAATILSMLVALVASAAGKGCGGAEPN
jgi:hypothetical protein